MSDPKTRIGFIGAGTMGGLHLQHFSRLPDVEMAAVADSNPVRLKTAQTTYGIPAAYSDGAPLIADADVDGIIISVPNRLHARLAIDALRVGRHVLLEKPMATSAAEAKAILDAERESGRKLLIGHNMRWSWPYAAIKPQVEAGEFGKIYYVKAGWFRRKGIPAWGSPYTQHAYMGGGAAYDIGVHMLDLAMHLIGGDRKPVSVFGAAYSKIGPQRIGLGTWGERSMAGSFDVDDLAAAMIRLDDATVINLEVSWAAFTDAEENGPYLHLMGDKGGVSVRGVAGKWMIERFDTAVDVVVPPVQEVDERTSIARHFIDCIQGDATPLVSGWSGYVNSAILEALYRSSETGHEVTDLL